MAKTVIVRRSVDYGSGRKASSYLIEGVNGYRFAKCSIWEAEELATNKAKKILNTVRRNDPRKDEATYDLVTLD